MKTPISPPTRDEIKAIDSHVGAQLKKRRKEMGLTQHGLAKTIGISYQQIQKYETGSNRISAGKLYWLANFLSVEVDFFYENIKEPQKTSIISKHVFQTTDFDQFERPIQKALANLANALSNSS